ncbi:MAG: GyrI-like domain-containing protein [Flavobacteriales bacterium]|nr:GyrI-like domain-containing protein [Flavobacteriales bacterium]
MKKLDLKKDFAVLYKATAKPAMIKVPKLRYLMIDGQGDPNTSKAFADAITTLYGLAYTMKFMLKKGPEAIDYPVMPLEAIWWADDMIDFTQGNKAKWKWTAMIMQPPFINAKMLKAAKDDLERKKKVLPAIYDVRLEDMSEGASAHILHVGPYATEGPTIAKLHAFIEENGKSLRGKHREIYLNDARRTAPEKLRTIIRQPMG